MLPDCDVVKGGGMFMLAPCDGLRELLVDMFGDVVCENERRGDVG